VGECDDDVLSPPILTLTLKMSSFVLYVMCIFLFYISHKAFEKTKWTERIKNVRLEKKNILIQMFRSFVAFRRGCLNGLPNYKEWSPFNSSSSRTRHLLTEKRLFSCCSPLCRCDWQLMFTYYFWLVYFYTSTLSCFVNKQHEENCIH
jgi:hypothetical protein